MTTKSQLTAQRLRATGSTESASVTLRPQIAVVDDGIIISTPGKSRLMFTNDTIYFDNEGSRGSDSTTETA